MKKITLITLLLTLFLITISVTSAAENTADLGNLITDAPNNSKVELGEGTYKTNVTNINIDKNLTIVGKGTDKTIIDANKTGRIFNIQYNGTLTLINLTLTNGNSSNGGAIYNNGILILKNCILTNNNADWGGAIYLTKGTLNTINNSTFSNNIAKTYGGAIACSGGSSNTGNVNINNTIFNNNIVGTFDDDYAHAGGAIFIRQFTVTLFNCAFNNNKAIQSGGAINIDNQGKVTVNNCTFKNNQAKSGGAIQNSEASTLNVLHSKFHNNNANGTYNGGGPIFGTYGGGAISNVYGALTVINSTFSNNNADETYGGAISNAGGIMRINTSIFSNNKAVKGGAISNIFIPGRSYNPTMNLTTSFFNNNTAMEGAGIYINGSGSNITKCNFTDHEQVISLNASNITIMGCNIMNNGIGILISEYSKNITINYNRIFNNTGYDLNNKGKDTNADYNWWGNNTADMINKIIGILPNNYFVMSVTNATPLDSNGTVTFQYIFKLNDSSVFDPNLLPYFTTNVYTNLTSDNIESFDGRFDNIFDVTVNTSGNVLYSFVTDNEVQTLEGITTISELIEPADPADPADSIDPVDPATPVNPGTPIEPQDPSNPTDLVDLDENNSTAKANNNPTAKAAIMKETGIPILAILVVLISSLGLLYRKK